MNWVLHETDDDGEVDLTAGLLGTDDDLDEEEEADEEETF
jgi:hypothetical protein